MALLQILSIGARARWNSVLRPWSSRTLRYSLAALALTVGDQAQAQTPATEGAWAAYDWACDTANLGPVIGNRVRMYHGALIPHGPYRGCVLTWGKYDNSTQTFLWNPNNPDRLFRIANTWGGSSRQVDAAAMTWDDEGQLVIVAAQHANVSSPTGLSSAWRLFPAALNFPPTVNLPGGACFAEVGGSAWRALQNMSVERYRPALFTMAEGLIPSSVLGNSVLALGGTLNQATLPVSNGWEYWQALAPRSTPGGSGWSSTLMPNVPPLNPNPLPPGTPTEIYVLQNGLTESKVEAAPCALQLADSGPQPTRFTKASFVAQDSLVSYTTPPTPSSHAVGLSTVVRPRYDANPQSWELWPRGAGGANERSQGSVVLRHDLAGVNSSFSGKNRVFSVGGAYHLPTGWYTMPAVHEYLTTTAQTLGQGVWTYQSVQGLVPFALGRIDNSAVVLPTGDILVVGGGRIAGATLGTATVAVTADDVSRTATPVHRPQVLRPGQQGTSPSGIPPAGAPWSVAEMAIAPTNLATGLIAPRGQGHSAVLLPDGRVLVSGGDSLVTGQLGLAFTGDIFSPPYLFQSFRPTLTNIQDSSLDFGEEFTLAVGRQPNEVIDAVVLLRPASTCYGFDSSQRYIELEFTLEEYDDVMGTQGVIARAPSDQLGPTGHYLLYVVSHLVGDPTQRVPSVGQFIHLK